MNIITRFDDGKKDKVIFVLLQNSGEIIKGEVNVVVIFPKKMKALKGNLQILLTLAEGVINNLPGAPQPGVTFVRNIKGLSSIVGPGTEAGKYSASVQISAKVSSYFEF